MSAREEILRQCYLACEERLQEALESIDEVGGMREALQLQIQRLSAHVRSLRAVSEELHLSTAHLALHLTDMEAQLRGTEADELPEHPSGDVAVDITLATAPDLITDTAVEEDLEIPRQDERREKVASGSLASEAMVTPELDIDVASAVTELEARLREQQQEVQKLEAQLHKCREEVASGSTERLRLLAEQQAMRNMVAKLGGPISALVDNVGRAEEHTIALESVVKQHTHEDVAPSPPTSLLQPADLAPNPPDAVAASTQASAFRLHKGKAQEVAPGSSSMEANRAPARELKTYAEMVSGVQARSQMRAGPPAAVEEAAMSAEAEMSALAEAAAQGVSNLRAAVHSFSATFVNLELVVAGFEVVQEREHMAQRNRLPDLVSRLRDAASAVSEAAEVLQLLA